MLVAVGDGLDEIGDPHMSLLDMVLDENPFLSEGEKHLAKRTEKVRSEIATKLNELKAMHARYASDAAKKPMVVELMKLIRDAMAMCNSKEISLSAGETQRWWDEMTESCRPVGKAAIAARCTQGRPSKANIAAAAAEHALAGSNTPGGSLLPGSSDAARDGGERQTRYIDWGSEPLETIPFEMIEFDEARFKELCASDKAGARTMGTAAMKKVLALTSDRIFSQAQETKLNMCEGKWPKGDSLRSWVLRPALPEGRDSTLTVKIAYSNSAKAFLVHSTHLPRKNSSRRSGSLDLTASGIASMAGLAAMAPPKSPPYMVMGGVMAAETSPLPSVPMRRPTPPMAPNGSGSASGSPVKRPRESIMAAQFVPGIVLDPEAASEAQRFAKRSTPFKGPP